MPITVQNTANIYTEVNYFYRNAQNKRVRHELPKTIFRKWHRRRYKCKECQKNKRLNYTAFQTLQFRLSNKFRKIGHGPPSVLTSKEEKEIIDWIFEYQQKRFPRRFEDIQSSVRQFLNNVPRKNPIQKKYTRNWMV